MKTFMCPTDTPPFEPDCLLLLLLLTVTVFTAVFETL